MSHLINVIDATIQTLECLQPFKMTDSHVNSDTKLSVVMYTLTLLQYILAVLLGLMHDGVDQVKSVTSNWITGKRNTESDLLSYTSTFYERRLFSLMRDCWNRPIYSSPSSWIAVNNNNWCLNLGSYNYLGFGDNLDKQHSIDAIHKFGAASCSFRSAIGTNQLHLDLEYEIAKFVGKPNALICSMGFATNSTIIPIVCGPDDLIISDSLNHRSIVDGARLAGSKVQTFKHNDVQDLENILQKATGVDRKHSYGKILIIVEGVYSMEGDLPPLREIVELKQKYQAYLWLDEAHSIGALGPTGRGVCEQLNVHPSNVDICMGTFTKSFGSVGGYVAASTELIDALKHSTAAHVHSASLAPAACAQVLHALQTLNTSAGRERIQTLQSNSRYFRRQLVDMGLLVLGDDFSPVIPALLGLPAKISAFSRLCLQHHLAVVVVGYPATPLMLPRARFCISAAHTKEDLDFALGVLETLSDRCHLRYHRKMFG